jgi:alpha-1,2-glucosyltransferase
MAKLWDQHDKRLWLETLWFGVVNAGTMWLFLHRGFEWEQEPGSVQRFMW